MLQGHGYPYEQVLQQYNDEIVLVVCAYLPQFQTFSRTKGVATCLIVGFFISVDAVGYDRLDRRPWFQEEEVLALVHGSLIGCSQEA